MSVILRVYGLNLQTSRHIFNFQNCLIFKVLNRFIYEIIIMSNLLKAHQLEQVMTLKMEQLY